MAIEAGWGAVGGPSGVCNAGVRVEDLGEVWLLILDQGLQLGDLADLLEGEDLVLLVAVYSQTGRVVAAVFEAGQSIDEGVDDELAVLLHEVVDVAENATVEEVSVEVDSWGQREGDGEGQLKPAGSREDTHHMVGNMG